MSGHASTSPLLGPLVTSTDRATWRLPARFVPLAFAMTMSLIVTGCVSAMLIAVNTGIDAGYPFRWLRAWPMAWAVAFPMVYLVSPRVRAVLTRLSA